MLSVLYTWAHVQYQDPIGIRLQRKVYPFYTRLKCIWGDGMNKWLMRYSVKSMVSFLIHVPRFSPPPHPQKDIRWDPPWSAYAGGHTYPGGNFQALLVSLFGLVFFLSPC